MVRTGHLSDSARVRLAPKLSLSQGPGAVLGPWSGIFTFLYERSGVKRDKNKGFLIPMRASETVKGTWPDAIGGSP